MYGSNKSNKNNPALTAKNGFSGEFVSEEKQKNTPPTPKIVTHKIGGILPLGETVQISYQKTPEKQSHFFFESTANLTKQEQSLRLTHQQELQKALNELRSQIHQLVKTTKNLDHKTQKMSLEADSVPEANPYQISILQRVKQSIINFIKSRQNISPASLWLESLTTKKKKRNAFWNRVKSSGQQYLFSGEHAASRSAA